MRLVQHPVSLTWTDLVPTAGPQVLGGSTSLTQYVQSVVSPHGLVGFDVTYPVREAVAARALNGMVSDLEGGANVLLFPWRDIAAEPDRAEFGLSAGPWPNLPWGNGLAWGNGEAWRTAPAGTVTLGDSELDASEITLSLAAWPWAAAGLRGTVIGFAGHWGAYTIQSCRLSGGAATCRLWPSLRRRVAAGTLVTLRPVIGMRLVSADGGRYRDARRQRADLTLSLVEVPDDVIRRYAERRTVAVAWYASPAWTVEGWGPAVIADFRWKLFALPAGVTAAAVPTTAPAALQSLEKKTFADCFAFTRTSTTTATRVDASGAVVADVGVDEPRYDYLYGERRLLLEPARTNLVPYSAGLNDANWIKSNIAVSADATVAPSGATVADKVVETAGSASRSIACAGFSVTAGLKYAFTSYWTPHARNWTRKQLDSGSFGSSNSTWYDILTGALGTVQGGTAASILASRSPWYRLCYIRQATATAGSALYIGPADANGGVTYTGDGVSGQSGWGVQFEQGDYETAYIPTTTSSATRTIETAAEAAVVRAISGLSAWSFGLRFRPHAATDGVIWQADDGTTSNRITLSVAAGLVTLEVVTAGATVYRATSANAIVATAENTVACRIKQGSLALTVNGGAVPSPTVNTGGALPALTQSALARDLTGTAYCAMRLARMLKYPAALSDAGLKGMPL